MKIVFQIVLIVFIILYLFGVIGENTLKNRIFFIAAATILAAVFIVTIAVI